MKKNIKQVFATILVLIILSVAVSAAEYLIPFQGQASDSSNNPLATGDISVRIYDAATGGSLVYDSGTDFNGAISDGIYDVLLGSITPLDLDDTKKYFLELDINGEEVVGDATSGRQVFWPSAGNHTQSWNDLIDVPAGFADGVDDTTAGGNGTVTQVNTGAGLTGGPITTTGTISVPNGGITNAMLANDGISMLCGAGLSCNSLVTLGETSFIDLTIVPTVNGGTGLNTGPTAAGQFLRSVGFDQWSNGVIQASDVPPLTLAGDVTGNTGASQVTSLQGNILSSSAPSSGDVLTWDGFSWTPAVSAGGADSDWNISGDDIFKEIGNVGIGTTTPTQKLHVVGDANITGNLYAGTGSAVLFVDDANNRVGIGTTTPDWTFTSKGGIHQIGGGAEGTAASIAMTDSAGNDWTLMVGGFATGNLEIWEGLGGGSHRVTFEQGGNVGIGTVTPSNKLEVIGNVELTNLFDNDASNFFDGGCGDNQHVTGISSTGAVSCGADTGDISGVTAGSGLTGGGTSGSVTLNVNTGTTANKIVQLDGSARLPAVDGSQLTNLPSGSGDITAVTAGTGLTGGGVTGDVTLNHADTSSQLSVNNAGGSVIQDLTLDTFGHLTNIISSNLDNRYFTESESESNYVNIVGDTMTGVLTLPSNGLTIGTNQLVVSSGNVGIGTTNPSEQLVVEGSAPTLLLQNPVLNNANSGKIQFSEGGLIGTTLRYDGNLNKFFIDTTSVTGAVTIDRFTGNVGIGTINPGAKLQVEGGGEYLRVIPNSPANHVTLATPVSHLLLDSGGRVEIDIFGAGDHFKVTQGGSSDLFTVKGNGNVGIGTANPAQKLVVEGDIRVPISNKVMLGGPFTGEYIHNPTGSSLGISVNNIDRITIANGGNVGIGTTNPTQKLEVVGNAHVEGDLTWNEKTGYVSVSAAAFRPETNFGEFNFNEGDTVHRGSGMLQYASVQLPHGATVTKVTGYFNALTPTTMFSLHRNNMDNSNQIMANITTDIFGGPRVANDDSIDFATIDNSQYSYYFQLTLGIEDIRLHGVVIEYTFTEPY